MKRINNIYSNVYDIKKISDMCDKVCSKVKNKDKVESFMLYKSEHIINIKNKLKSKKINFSHYNIFFITDPKCRLIMSQNIEDKIINHLIADTFLVNIFEGTFNESVCATRVGKGTSYGISLLKKYINKIKRKTKEIYYLQLDITKYFYNINHEILKTIIRKKIKDKDVLMILDEIIDSTNHDYINKKISILKRQRIKFLENGNFNRNTIDEVNAIPLYQKGKGCSIGNQTSQAFGIIYLNEFNHYLKENLKLKYVVNYMDDFIILHDNKEYLKKCLIQIETFLNKNLKLEVNKNKTKISSIKNGISFLGYRFVLNNNQLIVKIGNRSKRNFKKKICELKLLYQNNFLDKKDITRYISSYKGLLKQGNCRSLYYHYLKK